MPCLLYFGVFGDDHLKADFRISHDRSSRVSDRDGDFFQTPVDFQCSEVQAGKKLAKPEAIFFTAGIVSEMRHPA